MLEENLKEGIKVRIARDISKTKNSFDANSTMRAMADGITQYYVEHVRNKEAYGLSYTKVPIIHGFNWHPADLIWDEEPGLDDISLQGEKQTFDVNELRAL